MTIFTFCTQVRFLLIDNHRLKKIMDDTVSSNSFNAELSIKLKIELSAFSRRVIPCAVLVFKIN